MRILIITMIGVCLILGSVTAFLLNMFWEEMPTAVYALLTGSGISTTLHTFVFLMHLRTHTSLRSMKEEVP